MWPRGLAEATLLLRLHGVTQASGEGTRSSSRFAAIASAHAVRHLTPPGCCQNAEQQRVQAELEAKALFPMLFAFN